jgi:hypothetical protein
MLSSYSYNHNGVTIFTDEPINTDDGMLQRLEEVIGNLPGVELVRTARYTVDVSFGTLFEPEDVLTPGDRDIQRLLWSTGVQPVQS